MSYLEEKLRESSKQAGDFSPPSGQWEVIRKRLKQETLPKRRTPFWIFFFALGLIAMGAVGNYWRTPNQASSKNTPVELGSLPIPIEFIADTSTIAEKFTPEKQLIPSAISMEVKQNNKQVSTTSPSPYFRRQTNDLNNQFIAQKNEPAINNETVELSTVLDISSDAATEVTPEELPKLSTKAVTIPLPKNEPISRAIGTPFSHRLEELTRLELPALIPLIMVKKKNRKLAPKHWYFQSSLGALPRPIEGFTSVYQADPRVGVSPVAIPVQGTNEWLEMYIVNEQYWAKGTTRWDKVLNFTFGRQFGSGWDISIGAMLFTAPNKINTMLTQVSPKSGQAHLFNNNYTQEFFSWVGFRYIFRRRHRFKPYVGISAIGILHEKDVSEEWFYYPDRSITQLMSRNTAQVNGFFLNAIPIPRAGFQYSLDHRWQIGLDIVFIFPSLQVQYNFR